MHYLISHLPTSRLAQAIAIAAVMMSLSLAFTASANGEDLGAVAASTGLVEESPTTEPESAPAPAADVESVAATASEPVEAAATSASSTIGATESASKAASSAVLSNSPQPELAKLPREAAANVSAVLAAPPAQLDRTAGTLSTEQLSVLDRVPELAGKIHRDTAKTAAQAVDQVTHIGRHVQTLPHDALQAASEVLRPGLLDLAIPAEIESLLSGILSETGTGAFSPSVAALPSKPLASAHPDGQATILNPVALQHLAEFGGVETLLLSALWANATLEHTAGATGMLPQVRIGGASLGGAGVCLEGPGLPSHNGPTPPPASPQAAASGLGSSSFVPIAALLALLALAAPAIHRRLRGMPAFAAPAPFVCALERPG